MIPPAKTPPKIISGKEKICQAFEIGETAFDKWIDRGLPARIIDGRWTGHLEDMESFIRNFIKKDSQ